MNNSYTGGKPLKIQFPMEQAFHEWQNVPEGNHRAELDKFGPRQSNTGKSGYRLTWCIRDPETNEKQFAANNYYGNGVNLLIKGIQLWLGDELKDHLDENNCLNPDDLLGLEADIEVTHIKTEGYDRPLCIATKFGAPGTLVKRKIRPATPEEALFHGLN
jgi:hypothetical protein